MKKKFAVFIDRDGTINRDVDNLSSLSELKLFPKTAQAILLLNQHKIPAIVITNQPVVARGLLKEEDIKRIHQKINEQIDKIGAKIDGFYFCPHHPEAYLEEYRLACNCRKPKTAMFEQAAKDFSIDLTKSYVIGDSFRDIKAGKAIGATTIAVMTNPGMIQGSKPDFLVEDLYKAVSLILKKRKL